MDWTIEHFEQSRLVKITPTGTCSIDENLRMIKNLVSQKFWKPGLNTLFDQRNLDLNGTSIDVMREVSENFKKYEAKIGNGKTAILMKSMADFARGRQFELLTNYEVSASVKIFLNEEEAIRWLTS